MTPEEILRTKHSIAIVGASNEPLKYGFELVSAFIENGYAVFPINPKYIGIEGIKFYSSLKELPSIPDVVVVALTPKNSINIVTIVKEIGAEIVWFPPNCFDEGAIAKAHELQISTISDVCPLWILKKMRASDS